MLLREVLPRSVCTWRIQRSGRRELLPFVYRGRDRDRLFWLLLRVAVQCRGALSLLLRSRGRQLDFMQVSGLLSGVGWSSFPVLGILSRFRAHEYFRRSIGLLMMGCSEPLVASLEYVVSARGDFVDLFMNVIVV